MLYKHAFVETAIMFRIFARYTSLVARHMIRNRIERKTLDPMTRVKHSFYRTVRINAVGDELDLQTAVLSAYTHMFKRISAH